MQFLYLRIVRTIARFIVSAVELVAAAQPEKGPGFVCPVLGGKAGENPNSPWQNVNHQWYNIKFKTIFDGDQTVIGPPVNVPEHATNNNGAGAPDGPHQSPGDENYSPIWWTP